MKNFDHKIIKEYSENTEELLQFEVRLKNDAYDKLGGV